MYAFPITQGLLHKALYLVRQDLLETDGGLRKDATD